MLGLFYGNITSIYRPTLYTCKMIILIVSVFGYELPFPQFATPDDNGNFVPIFSDNFVMTSGRLQSSLKSYSVTSWYDVYINYSDLRGYSGQV